MTAFWIVLILVVLVVLGNALMLLRTANNHRIPKGVKSQPYGIDEDD